MNDLDMLKKELQEVTNKQIKLQTIIEQAKQQCASIEHKYNITSEVELKNLLDIAQSEYEKNIADAMEYIAEAKLALQPYEGLI